ncbi:aldo/keto reductase [Anaeromyxobacter dehalogenans]|uniref:aldo/keto reductase n=1 Tax=Anaeromyxobacter dehalogenans TaxID=161493 RepID=UPI001FDFC08F|nr:aldo/keto reductase [Anaeromyxobacter dehalogenans]
MALELGLGITPWSPLKSGVLSGKYTRRNAGQVQAGRAAFIEGVLNERTYAVVDALEAVARAHDSTVARVALAWVRQRPGVTSTIIGARRWEQLEDNLSSLNVELTAEDRARLDALTQPAFGFRRACSPSSRHPQRRDHRRRRVRAAVALRPREGGPPVLMGGADALPRCRAHPGARRGRARPVAGARRDPATRIWPRPASAP